MIWNHVQMPSDWGYPVDDVDWCGQDEAASRLEAVRPGSAARTDWRRLMPAINSAGEHGYVRVSVEAEAQWWATATRPRRIARAVSRAAGIVIEFAANFF